MAILVRLDDARTLVRRRTDQVNSDQVTDAELTGWLNMGMRHYARILIAAQPDTYVLESSLNTTSGTYEYALPSGFLGLKGVDRVFSATDRTSLETFGWVDRNRYRRSNTDYPRYRWLRGGRAGAAVLQFASNPGTTTAGYLVHYVGVPADLSADGDTFDDMLGLSDYVVIYASACVREKLDEQELAMGLRAEMEKMEAAITQLGRIRTADGGVQVGGRSHDHDYDDEERYRWPT